jgi:hypothetical protein
MSSAIRFDLHLQRPQEKTHERLMEFASVANETGQVRGLRQFLLSGFDLAEIEQIVDWLDLHTPIRRQQNPNNLLLFVAPSALQGTFDKENANKHPFYSLLPQSPKAPLDPLAQKPFGSDRHAKVQALRTACETFIQQPTFSTKLALMEAAERYYALPDPRGSRPFVLQGGAPGLGKRK